MNKHPMKKFSTIILSLLFLQCSAHAQDPQKTIKLKFACDSLIQDRSQIVIPGNKGNLQLSLRHLSGEVLANYTEGSPLNLYPKDTIITPESIPIGSVKIPVAATSGMVLLYPEKGKYTGHYIEDIHFPRGSVLIRNLTKFNIAIEIGDKNKEINPLSKIIIKNEEPKAKSSNVKMSHSIDKKKWHLFFSSSWRLTPSHRELIVLYQKKGSTKVHFKAITQLNIPTASEAPPK